MCFLWNKGTLVLGGLFHQHDTACIAFDTYQEATRKMYMHPTYIIEQLISVTSKLLQSTTYEKKSRLVGSDAKKE